MEKGRDIAQHGINYRIDYEKQFEKHGKIVTKYCLQPPTLVEATIAIIVSGVVGNAAYDGLKVILKRLHNEITKRKPKPNAAKSDLQLYAKDAGLLYRLTGNDDKYARQFESYAQEYVNRNESAPPPVQMALDEERVSGQYSSILQSDPAKFVFVGRNASRFHRKSCHYLHLPKRRMRVRKAILSELVPCRICKPLAE